MSFSDTVILDAIASHLRARTAPTGETIKAVFAYPPDGIATSPIITLYPQGDSIRYGAANRQVTLTVEAVLYLPQVEYSRQLARVAAFRTWMRDAFLDGVLLDSADGVSQASVTSTSIGSSEYGDAPWITVSATIEVTGVEAIAPSA